MGEPIEALIAKTQETLQPLVAKPKLADKLLMKPPFRFLHDVFAAVTQSRGFAQGLYTPFELDSANLKEKHHKTAYLDKMIVCVGMCLGKDVDVRSAKIVAGLEPENTNIFLQDLAQTASNASLDWAGAVTKTLQKIPSLTADGVSATVAAPAAAAEAKAAAPERPASKEKAASGDADKVAAEKAAEKAAAEAKAKERARKEKEEAEKKAAREAEDGRAKSEAKAESSAPAGESKPRASSSSGSKSTKPQDNNRSAEDESLLLHIKECNGDVERTKDVIEKIIAKPKMNAKLLSKPPFRFLHDIVSEITRVTGFAEGLYNAEELDSASIKEKGPKIDYLTKIVQCVSCHLNVEIEAKPAKIVAGLEPDDTNKLLQLLAIACRHGSSAEAVQRVLSGDTAVRSSSASSQKSSAGARSGGSIKAAEQREATPEAKLSSRSATPQESKTRSSKESKETTGTFGGATPAAAAPASAAPGSFAAMKPLTVPPPSNDDDQDDNANLRFSEAKHGDDDSVAPSTSGGNMSSRTSRPTTARRRPPKLKENVTEIGRLHVHDPKVAPVAGIMKDGDNGDSDDDTGGADDNNNSNGPSASMHEHTGGAHGRLVRDILKDEEAARKQKEDEDMADGQGGNEGETGIRLGRRRKSFKDKSKAAASSFAEMNELRLSIQRICQATNPVGKNVEFVHEDLEAMSKELEHWKKEYESKRSMYEDEKKKTEDALQPLQMQLLEVEEQIKEQVHKINTLKTTIAKNEEKTQKLLHMVVSA